MPLSELAVAMPPSDASTVAKPLLPLLVLGARMAVLRQDLLHELISHESDAVRALAADLPELRTEDAINIVLVGQHDAGKSLLVRCLTGRDDIQVGAGPLTDRSTAYEWNGHRLVDTPGVCAGVRTEHDRLAEEALKAADVVLFVLTIEGLDDVVGRYFARLRHRLRSLRGLVIVVNKTQSERSNRDVAQQDLARTVGPTVDLVPVVWTDAKRWADVEGKEDLRGFREQSGLRELSDTVTELIHVSGAHVRLMTPLRAWSDTAQQALHHLSQGSSGDENDLAQIDALAAQLEAAYEDTQIALDRRADDAVVGLTAGLRGAGPEVDKKTFEQMVQAAADLFDERAVEDGMRVDDALLTRVNTQAERGVATASVDAKRLLQKSLAQVSQNFSGQGARPGGSGHTVVVKLWHGLGASFGPGEQ